MRHALTALAFIAGLATVTFFGMSREASAEGPAITVHKTPWCGCCTDWADHLRADGFDVTIREHEDLGNVRDRLGVPIALGSCLNSMNFLKMATALVSHSWCKATTTSAKPSFP